MFRTNDRTKYVGHTAKTTALACAFLLAALAAPSSALALEFTEGFEEGTTSIGDVFFSGPLGQRATFSGPTNQITCCIPFNGDNSWRTGVIASTITFSANPASAVAFYIRTAVGTLGNTIVRVFDDSNVLQDSVSISPAAEWVHYAYTGEVGRITIQNNAPLRNSLDDFSWSVPEPSIAMLLGTGILGLAITRRRTS